MRLAQSHLSSRAVSLVLLWTSIHLHLTPCSAVSALNLGTSNLTDDVGQWFTHDFRTGLHGWVIRKKWRWTKDEGFPTLTNNQSLLSQDGNYIWINETAKEPDNSSLANVVFYGPVVGLTKHAQFHVEYLIDAFDGHCAHFDVFFTSANDNLVLFHSKVTGVTSHNWTTYTVDCGQEQCCHQYNCNLIIFIRASIDCVDASGLIAIQRVSATGIGNEAVIGSGVSDWWPALFYILSMLLTCLSFASFLRWCGKLITRT